MNENNVIPVYDLIYEVRGHKVMLDCDLAKLYEIETKDLNRAVKRNIERFPELFMFQLTNDEWIFLRCQFGTLKKYNRKYLPYVFTEHGVLMLSSVINSKKAIKINIEIMETFVKLRQYALFQNNSNEQINELRKLLMLHIENSDDKFSKHDEAIKQIVLALNNLLEKPKETKTIGFKKG